MLIVFLSISNTQADVIVPEDFMIDKLMNQTDGQIPILTAITNYEYGFGVIAASIENGILIVRRLSQSSIDILGTKSGFATRGAGAEVYSVKFDNTGLYSNNLYLSVNETIDNDDDLEKTNIVEVLPNGEVDIKAFIGNNSDKLVFRFAFSNASNNYNSGISLEDAHVSDGTSFYYMDSEFDFTKLSQNLLPAGRTDLDIKSMDFDPTSLYGSYLTMIDTDPNHDDKTVIYQLSSDLAWIELSTPVSTSVRAYRDMAFSNGGSFGEMLYVTDRISEAIMTVTPDGIHKEFAYGFTNIESISVSADGEHMFVSDENGIYRIRQNTVTVGPSIVMREPKVENDDVHSGDEGVDTVRILWNERVTFSNEDIEIKNEIGEEIAFSLVGSNTQFMLIVFGKILLNDKYYITIKDTVLSVGGNRSIDGDTDGIAGGDANFTMEHHGQTECEGETECTQVVTYAQPPETGCWVMFSTPCDVPKGWEIVYEEPSNMCGSVDDTSSENTDNCSTFDVFSNTLHVPCFNGGSTMYWLDLELTGSEPVTLELKDLGTN